MGAAVIALPRRSINSRRLIDHLAGARWRSRAVLVGRLTRTPKVHPLSNYRASPAHNIAEGSLLPNRSGPWPGCCPQIIEAARAAIALSLGNGG